MTTTTAKDKSVLRRFANGIAKIFGFSKTYNVFLYIIFAGALCGFSLARLQFLDISGVFCKGRNGATAPGECFYYHAGIYRVGMVLHLAGILPAAVLAVLQFVPKIRHAVLLFHRVNGYFIIALVLIGNAGALMIARHAYGGGLEIQSVVGVLAIMTTGSLVMAYINVKRLQIDQHRAWMLRLWFYLGTILTARIIIFISGIIATQVGNYYTLWPCDKLEYTIGSRNATLAKYPSCELHRSIPVAVRASFVGGSPENVGAALGVGFGMALWIAIWLHAIGVEIYIHLTPGESARLRKVSYERQLEAGLDYPGNAGLTGERLGDMKTS